MIATIVLAVAAALLFYIILGYPLLLRIVRWRQWPVAKDLSYTPTVTVVLAVFNGQEFIRKKLESLLALDYPETLLDVVVVSDGSTDGTEAVVEEFASRRVRLIRASRGGKAAALNFGIAAARGEILFFTDVRQPIEKQALRHLTANFADANVGAVSGELRYIDPGEGEQAMMDLYWRYEIWARKKHSAIDSLMGATGCIYAIRRELVQPLPVDTLSDDVLLPVRAFLSGRRVVIDGEAIAFDYPTKTGTEFPRKIRTLAGLWQIFARQPELFTSKNRMRTHFLAHKFGRLAMPWVLLAFVIASIAMPDSWFRTTLLWGQAGVVLLAFLDRWMPAGILKKLTAAARAFLLMNAASLLAIRVFYVPPQNLWKRTQVGT